MHLGKVHGLSEELAQLNASLREEGNSSCHLAAAGWVPKIGTCFDVVCSAGDTFNMVSGSSSSRCVVF
jgi:hypothetical protein